MPSDFEVLVALVICVRLSIDNIKQNMGGSDVIRVNRPTEHHCLEKGGM